MCVCMYVDAAAKSLQSCPTLCDPIVGSPQAPPSLGFSRQEHWSGLPLYLIFVLKWFQVWPQGALSGSLQCSFDCPDPFVSEHFLPSRTTHRVSSLPQV